MRKCVTNNRGAVLITGLIILVVLSVIGLVAMQSTTLQERMAGNLEQRDSAFQMAEAGLRDAEAWLSNPDMVVLPSFSSTAGLYANADPARIKGANFWADGSPGNYFSYQAQDLADVTDGPLPRYIIEYMMAVKVDGNESAKFGAEEEDAQMFKITSRGVSPNGRVEVILQSTYLR